MFHLPTARELALLCFARSPTRVALRAALCFCNRLPNVALNGDYPTSRVRIPLPSLRQFVTPPLICLLLYLSPVALGVTSWQVTVTSNCPAHLPTLVVTYALRCSMGIAIPRVGLAYVKGRKCVGRSYCLPPSTGDPYVYLRGRQVPAVGTQAICNGVTQRGIRLLKPIPPSAKLMTLRLMH